MNNLIFLDIDGVLNNIKVLFNEESINVIKELIKKYNARVVIISSWQMNGRESIRKKIRTVLEKQGIYGIDFIDPNFEGYLRDIKIPNRLLGIVDYLKCNPDSNYVIFDDDYHNDYRMLCLNHYRTMPLKGLLSKDLEKISFKKVNINNFKHIEYKYRKLGEYELATNNLIKVLKQIPPKNN